MKPKQEINPVRFGVTTVVCLLLLAGCGGQLPLEYTSSEQTRTLAPETQQQIRAELEKHFGTPREPNVPLEAQVAGLQRGRLAQGAHLYRRHCMHCHGVSGDGEGPTSRFLFPRPRDYRPGVFKFTSTARTVGGQQGKPIRKDLHQTLVDGIVGTAMPSFRVLPEDEVEALLDYLLHLSIRGQVEAYTALAYEGGDLTKEELEEEVGRDITDVARSWQEAGQNVIIPPAGVEPPFDRASIDRGRELFLSAGAQCSACHGNKGRGDGPSAEVYQGKPMLDDWNQTLRPANLTLGLYRGGRRPVDLYRRVFAGIKGTPMPEVWRGFLKPGEPDDPALAAPRIWDAVHFVQTLPYEKRPQMAAAAGAH